MVDYNILLYILAVYHYQNISQAAEDIHISRQALSKAISNFEKKVGQQLFQRTASGLIPTSYAKSIIPHIKNMVHEFNYIVSDQLMTKLSSKKVTISTFDAFSQVFSSEFFMEFSKQYPDIIINIEESTDEIAKDQLLMHESDFAIVSDSVNYTDFNYTFLFHAPYGIFVNESHPLAAKKRLTCKDLINEKLIGKTQKLKYYMQYVKDISELDTDFNFVIELTNNGASRNLIKNNVGIAVAWDYTYFSKINDGVVFRPIEDMGRGIDIYLIENKDSEYTSNQRKLKEYILKWFQVQVEKRKNIH